MKLSTLAGAAAVLVMLLLSSPGVRITRVDLPATQPAPEPTAARLH